MLRWTFVKTALFNSRNLVVLVFTGILLLGLSVSGDYGISWDEPVQREYGKIVWNHVIGGGSSLHSYANRHYGPIYESVLYGLEKILHLKDTRAVFLMRHTVNFLVFYIGIIFFYLLCKERFKSWRVALLGSLILVLSPRIFAHSFYNSKDLPFLALFIVSIYTLNRFLREKNFGNAFWHALVCAILTDVRVIGVLVPVLTSLAVAMDSWLPLSGRGEKKDNWKYLASYFSMFCCLTVLFWPTLWPNPVYHFWTAVREMSRFPWTGSDLYFGEFILGSALPWHYSPAWIAISTPLIYLLGLVLGVFALAKSMITNPRRLWLQYRLDFLILLWLLSPLIAVAVFRSVLYGTWRHTFFVYPALLMITLAGFQHLYHNVEIPLIDRKRRIARSAVVCFIAVNLGGIAHFMVKNHPFQHLFFNQLVGGTRGARFNFDMDYWGLSYRKALEFVLNHDPGLQVPVFVEDLPGRYNADILEYEQRRRLLFMADPSKAKYFIGVYNSRREEYRYGNECHVIEVGGAKVLTVQEIEGSAQTNAELLAPEIASIIDQNQNLTQEQTVVEIRCAVEEQLLKSLDNYIRGASDFELESGGFELIREGRIQKLILRGSEAKIGDFKHGNLGLPMRHFELVITDLILDLAQLAEGLFAPVQLGVLQINRLQISALDVNRILATSRDGLENVRVSFEPERLRALWLGEPKLEVELSVRIAPDFLEKDSENLWLEVRRASISGVVVPRLIVQWLLEEYNPLFDVDSLRGKIKLGHVKIGDQVLILGVSAK